MNNATAVITITDDSTSVVVTCVDGKVYNFATASSSEEGGDDEPASTVLEFGENTITIGLGQMYLGVEVTFTATEDGVYVITAGDNTYVSYEIGFDYFAFSNGESKEIKLAADESITFVVMRDDWTSGDAFVTVSAKEEACAHSNTTTSTTPASCSTDGSSVVTCEDCGEVVSSDVIPATGNHTYVEGVCSVCEAEDPDYVAPTVGTLATFDFGANGTAAHVDNQNALTGNTTVTSGDYSLVITSPSKVYDACFDEKGNSCLKLGSSSAIGSFSFTVSENVTEVVIYVAKYKDKTTKVSINGGAAQTINTSSNNGEYTAITIDTTTTKTISFATVSGGARCMINTIVFNGYAK